MSASIVRPRRDGRVVGTFDAPFYINFEVQHGVSSRILSWCTLKCTLGNGISGLYCGRARKRRSPISLFRGHLRSRRVFGGLGRLASKTGGCRFDSCRACFAKSMQDLALRFSPERPPLQAPRRMVTELVALPGWDRRELRASRKRRRSATGLAAIAKRATTLQGAPHTRWSAGLHPWGPPTAVPRGSHTEPRRTA